MKNLIKKVGMLTGLFVVAFAYSLIANPATVKQPRDSIIIDFDNNTKILIYVKDKSDLENLRSFDLNAMLRDVSLSIDSSKNVTYLKLEDDGGDKYLKDTTVVFDSDPDEDDFERSRSSDDHENKARIKLGNYRLEVDVDDIEDLEETFEDIEDDGLKVTSSTEEKRLRKTTHEFNVEIGVNNYLEDGDFPDGNANYSVKPWGSWYVGFSSIHKTAIGNGPFFLEWGGTLHWYNFKLDNEDIQIVKTENGTEYLEPPVGTTGIKSKLTASYLSAVLVPMLDFSRGTRKVKKYESGSISISKYKKQGVRIGVGGYAGYRLGSHTKYRFKQDGDKDRDKTSGNFNLNNFRYGVRGQIGYKGMDFFINYDLNELFNDDKGPAKLNAISFGFIL
ncbi:hypothetical protein QQ020_25345 [Fulvivirgaceae bacterium BMA12]|uniref:Outer membrane protein beta-barrel domain-containing protein n=1 Tax=Agaribacillus aureus TaxID=3051825 RepID=A0ABT8LCC4_9BACT|nr:hypothetical protein [Fulvivirgaceae bacterium BMA12]